MRIFVPKKRSRRDPKVPVEQPELPEEEAQLQPKKMSFSEEEKKAILLFALEHGLEDEDQWREFAQAIGRDLGEVRNACRDWQADQSTASAIDPVDEVIPESEEILREIDNFVEETEKLAESTKFKDVEEIVNVEAADEINNIEHNGQVDELQFINVNGQLVNINDLEQYAFADPEALADINFEEQTVSVVRNKRRLNLNELDAKLLETMIYQSEEELELKRAEHKKKMTLYTMQLEQSKELHEERMEILRTKLRSVQQKIHHIDHAICNKNLSKRFRSGPI